VVMGVLTGMIAIQAVRRLDEPGQRAEPGPELTAVDESALPAGSSSMPGSLLGRLPPAAKVAAVMVIGLAVVVFSDFRLYAAVFGLLVVLAVLGRLAPGSLLAGMKRVWVLLLASLALPVVFSPWGRVIFALGPLRVTAQGLVAGGVFAARILLLFFATAVLARTTSPAGVATGLEQLLAPLRVFRVKPGRLARSLSLSWAYFPVFWQSVREMVRRGDGRRGWLERIVHLPGDVVADLYLLAERYAERPRK